MAKWSYLVDIGGMNNKADISTRRVGLLLLGGHHHILHLVPIAAGIEAETDFDIIVYVTRESEAALCRNLLAGLGAVRTQVQILGANRVLKSISPKLAFLLSNLKTWKALDALIVAERTSTILRYATRALPPFIHTRHGAGDRAKGFDPRIRHFDHVLVAGPKDKARMIDCGLATDSSCYATGYIKPYVVRRIYPKLDKCFNNDKPTVLYNPHFNLGLSSWAEFGQDLLEAFSKRADFNFIIAPHMRLFAKASRAERESLERFSKFDHMHIDLGSERSADMSYTREADIFLGDVSSQVYEFLSEPKPCVFIGNKDVSWENNPDYAHWAYGPVCHSTAQVLGALERAQDSLPEYSARQAQGCLAAKGSPDWDPITRAGKIIRDILGPG